MKHDTTKPSHPDECNILKRDPDTETIDRLFLELSQFTGATTGRELKWRDRVRELERQLDEANTLTRAGVEHLREKLRLMQSDYDWTLQKLNEARAEAVRSRGDCEGACKTVAEMHAAAMGKICGPARGVVEDVEDLRKERDALKAEYDMRVDWIRRMVKILGCENVAGRDCRDPHLVAETIVENNARWYEEIQNLKANNRYQKGHTDGFQCAVDSLQTHLKSFKP